MGCYRIKGGAKLEGEVAISGSKNSSLPIIAACLLNGGVTQLSEPYYRKELNELMVNTLITSSMFGLDNSRMDENNANADTSNDFILYRINKKVREELDKQKKEGKEFLSDQEIDEVISQVLKEQSYAKD